MVASIDGSIIDGGPTPPVEEGPRMPHRVVWCSLPEEYPGFKVKLWVNFPQKLLNEINSGDEERIRESLSQIVVEHNNWRDENGAPLPPVGPEFWQAIPTELAIVIVALIRNESVKLPNSLLQQRLR